MTANNSTNNVVFFLVSDLKILQQLILDRNALNKRGQNILHPYVFRDKIIQAVSK